MVKTENQQSLHWNVFIDFLKKNNAKSWWKKTPTKRKTKLSSEHLIPKWNNLPIMHSDIENLEKLIKKWEKPVKIWSLMWLWEVGQCLFIEYEKDLIIIDAWMEFAAEDELWADYIVPDISYLKKNIKKLRWIILTHWHLDHVWALRDILPELNYPIIYTTPLTLWIVKKTFDDPKKSSKIKYKIINPDIDLLKLWCFTIEFVRVNHNIPETLALAIHTPKWLIFNSSDFKIDHTPAIDKPADLWKISRIWMEWVKLYIWDSLWTDREWRSISEKTIWDNLDDLIKETKSRIIIATFASNVWRIIQIINSAIKHNKIVFLSWRSILNNVEICQKLWYIKIPDWYIRKLSSDIDTFPDERVLILSTWAQWEEFAWLTRMARWEHNVVSLKKWDTVLMSASTIPWNELAINKMMNNLILKWINLITNSEIDIHASWHWYKEDHKMFLALLKPEFFLPYYMPPRERYNHKKIALEMGLPESRIIFPNDNWQIIEVYDDVVLIWKEKLTLDTVLVDWKWKWHLSWEYVVKARHIMAQNWVITLIFKVDAKTKWLVWNIQIESRWFVYSSEVKQIHTKIVDFARAKYNENMKKWKYVKDNLKQIKSDLSLYITQIIWRVPMVVPMFVYINREWKEVLSKDEAIVWMTIEEQWEDK